MSDKREDQFDLLISQALQEMPLVPVPDQLKGKIMGQIKQPIIAKRFRISLVDLAFSGAVALMIGLAIEFIQNITRSPYWRTHFQVSLTMVWQDLKYFLLHNQPSVQTAALSAAIFLALLAILASVYWRYAAASQRLASP